MKVPHPAVICHRKEHGADSDGIFLGSKHETSYWHRRHKPLNAVVDTGAAKTVVGLPTARRLSNAAGQPLQLHPSSRCFRFGITPHRSLGSFVLNLPTPSGIIDMTVDVIAQDVPLLLGLDMMDLHRIQPLVIYNLLQHVPANEGPGWCLPLTRIAGHLCLPITPIREAHRVLYTRTQLQRIHRALHHPSIEKLYQFLRRADPEKLNEETRQVLKDISASCHACQRHARAPLRFRVTIPGEARFNREVRIDLFWIKDPSDSTPSGRARPVLHVIDVATNFQSCKFLPGESSADIWNCFLLCWSKLYCGHPTKIQADAGSALVSKEFRNYCESTGIQMTQSPVEEHNALGQGESFHAIVRRIFLKLRTQWPKAEKEVILQCAVHAVNTSANAYGLIPSLLVFGCLPNVPHVPSSGPMPQSVRLEVAEMARAEYAKVVAEQRLSMALRHQIPRSADIAYSSGDRVYLYREKVKLWTGPWEIIRVEGKNVFLQVDSQGPKPFSITRVKLAVEEPEVSFDSASIQWTEVLNKGDPRTLTPEMLEAKRAEFVGLLKRGTFRLAVLPDGGQGENVVPSRFVLALKHPSDGSVKAKARFVIGGHRDRHKAAQMNTARNISATGVRLLLALASILGLQVWTEDVRQAYLQSASTLRRRIFTKPDDSELSLGKDEFLQIILPIYGLRESGDYWGLSLTEHCLRNAQMKQCATDLSLFFRRVGRDLVGLSASYVDDLIRAAPAEHRDFLLNSLRDQFECGPPKTVSHGGHTEFLGMEITKLHQAFALSMTKYIERLEFLPMDATYKQYSGLRASVQWLTHCRPDIAAFISIVSSVRCHSKTDILSLNAKVKHLKQTKELMLRFPSLDIETLRLVVYVDAGFANRADKSSQLGFVICLADASGRFCFLGFRSFKSTRVARSTSAAEIFAFAAGFDRAYAIRHELQTMLRRSVPLLVLTDSQQLFDIITLNRTTQEARLMIDIFAARQAFSRQEIDNIGLIASEHNLADDLSKMDGNGALVTSMRPGHVLDHPVRDYVIRPTEEV